MKNLTKLKTLLILLSSTSIVAAASPLETNPIDPKQPKVKSGKTTIGNNFIAFEAESTISKLPEGWVIIHEGVDGDLKVAGDLPASGGAYIQAVSGNTSGAGIKAGENVLQYKFKPKTSGTYQLTGRMAQNLALVEDAKKWDKANDIYLKMEGDYTQTPKTPIKHLENWEKYYGRGWANNLPKWGTFMKIDAHINGKDHKFDALYNLEAGKEYTLSISTRSKGLIIDYFLLSKSVPEHPENVDIATLLDEQYRPKNGIKLKKTIYKGNDFKALNNVDGTTIDPSNFVVAKIDYLKDQTGNNSYLSIVDWCKWGAAEVAYKGKNGRADIYINTLVEEDGESTYKLFVDDKFVGEVTNEKIYKTSIPNYTVVSTKLNKKRVPIKKGSIIRVEFNSATNGLVPEGKTTATSRGRWASVVVEL